MPFLAKNWKKLLLHSGPRGLGEGDGHLCACQHSDERVLEVEQSCFSPLVFSVTGALGNEAEKFYRNLARLLADKIKQAYADTIRYIRQRLSFTLLRTTIISLRGHRGNKFTKTSQYKSERHDINLLQSDPDLTAPDLAAPRLNKTAG